MKESRRRALVLVGVVALVALVAGLAVGGRLGNAAFLAYVRHQTGLRLDVRGVEHDGGVYVLNGITASTSDGSFLVSAPRARISLSGANAALELDRPSIVLSPARYRSSDAHVRLPSGVTRLTVHDGTLVVTGGDIPAPVFTFAGVAGEARFSPGGAQYDASLQLVDSTSEARGGGARENITGHADAGGTVWTAAAVPLQPLAALLPGGAPLQLRGGTLRDVEIDAGKTLRITGRLDDGAAAFEQHALTGLHGELTLVADGIGSRTLAGELDGVPFDVSGEVHDLPDRWWLDGSQDLDGLGIVLAKIANEPRLRSLKLEATAPGLAFAQYALATDHGPVAISLLSLDPAERTLRFDTTIAQDHVTSGGERTSAMSLRTGAIAGVNGDYFDIGRTYEPQGMLVRKGALVRGPTDRAALVIDRDNRLTIAEFRIRGEVRTAHGTMPLTEVNDWPPGDVCLITPAFGPTLPPSAGRTFVALQPLGSADSTRFRVTDVVAMNAPMAPRFGVAIGPLVHTPLPKVGETVSVTYILEPHVTGIVAGIGGGPILLRNGAWFEDRHAPAPDERDYRWPVIALMRTAAGRLMFVAVDGRHPERSVGMTRPEFGRLLLRLGGVDAMALDSGGSVTLVSRAPGDANASVRNVPSDNSAERWISDGLFLYSSAPPPTIVPVAHAPTPLPEARPSP